MGRNGFIVLIIAASLGAGGALAQNMQSQNAQSPDTQNQVSQPAGGQTEPTSPQRTEQDAVKDMIGSWELSNADHDRICRLNFRNDTVAQGYKVEIDRNCPNVFPSTKDIVAWTLDNYGNQTNSTSATGCW